MIHVPGPPPGSAILREDAPGGVKLSWPGHSRARGTMLTVSLAVAALGLLAGVVLALTVFGEGTEAFAAAGGLVLASFLATLMCVRLRSLFREGIVVGDEAVTWVPPASAAELSQHLGWDGSAPMYGHASMVARGLFRTALDLVVLWRKRESIRLTRAGITDLRLEGKGRFEHLSIQVGKACIDIAKRLSHEDRAWLLDVLRRWREAGG